MDIYSVLKVKIKENIKTLFLGIDNFDNDNFIKFKICWQTKTVSLVEIHDGNTQRKN